MADLPQNPTFEAMSSAALNIGKELKGRHKRPPVDLDRFKGVRGAVAGARQSGAGNVAGSAADFVKSSVKTTPFGGSTKFEEYHPGWDLATEEGTSIPSFSGGVVKEVQRGEAPGTSGFGNFAIVEDRQGNRFRYSHLRDVMVRIDEQVLPGRTIGTVGQTGSVYSRYGNNPSHLDIRIRDSFGKYVSPGLFLK